MSELARNSHYTPKAYFRPWSGTDARMHAYRLLVPHESYPQWARLAVSSAPVRRDLYTSVAEGRESDAAERWLNQEVETPALAALERLRRGDNLTASDRRPLARYLAALQVRGPTAYSDLVSGVAAMLDRSLQGIVEGAVETVSSARASGQPLPEPAPNSAALAAGFHTRVTASPTPEDPDRGVIEVRAVLGRELWLEQIRYVVNELSPILESHDWQVIAPCRGHSWFTSDDPFIRLAYMGDEDYHFRASWAQPNAELLLPLSPTQLLYTQVGRAARDIREFPMEHTVRVQRLIAKHAHRWIFSDMPSRRAQWIRPRVVDQRRFVDEEEQWRTFHEEQSAAVRDLATENDGETPSDDSNE